MQCVKYDDLLNVPFLYGGRDCKKGLDCYGLVLEMTRRNGKELKDLCFSSKQNSTVLSSTVEKLNVKEITQKESRAGDIVQCVLNNELHIAFLIDSKTVIHATFGGVRISPIFVLKDKKFFRVI